MGECGGLPGRGGVAVLAGGGEPGCPVIGIAYGVIDRLMAGEAVGWSSSVPAIYVAGGAGHCGMFAGQGKAGTVVVESCWFPGCGAVAGFAGCGESCRDVVRRRCSLEIRQVTTDTGGRSTGEFATHVAGSAGHGGVLTRKREACAGIVIKGGRAPG